MNATALSSKTQHALTFGSHEIKTITRDGQLWMSGSELRQALEYADEKAIHRIYNAHADEFSATMTKVMRVATTGGKQLIRFFSLRGAHLIAMFARTEKAKEFRIWVLDILDREIGEMKAAARDLTKLRDETRQEIEYLCLEVQYLASWWKRYGPAFDIINPHAYGRIFERFIFAPMRAVQIVKDLGLKSHREEAMSERWEWLAKESRQVAKMAARGAA